MTGILHLSEEYFENRHFLAIAIAVPLILLCSSISGVLCFLAVQMSQKRKISVTDVYARLGEKLPQLLFLTLLTGLIFLLGFAALILPGLIFMALYAFAQFLLYRDEKERPFWDVTLYLSRSSALVKRHLWNTVAIISFTFAAEMFSYLVSQSLGGYVGGFLDIEWMREGLSLGLEVVFAMVLGALCSTWLAVFFFQIEDHAGNR